MVKTRTIQREDGRREIVRVLSTDDIGHWSSKDPLAYEQSIVWTEDIERLRFVRSVEVRCARSRRGPLVLNSGERVVGYSKLTPDAPKDPQTACYTRRLFYLKNTDADLPVESPPQNAIDPKTVFPGVPGQPLNAAHN